MRSAITSELTAVRFSGPSLRAYTIAIPFSLSENEEKAKLKEFKDSIEFKKYKFAFALIPAPYFSLSKNLDKTEVFRNLFSTIELINLFNLESNPVFSADTENPSYNPCKCKE